MVTIASIPGMKDGSTIRNTLLGALYAVICMVAAVAVGEELLLFSPFIVAGLVGMNVRGAAETASAIPGVSPDGGLKSGAAVFAVMFIAVIVVYAAVPGGADQQSAGTNDSMTDQPDDAQAETAAETETETTQKQTQTETQTRPQTETPTATATPTPTPTATPTPTPTPETGFEIKVSYDGDWSGTVGTLGNSRSVDGSGTETFDVKKSNPDTVSVNAQKRDGSSGTLTVQIINNGNVVKESTTSAEYGMTQITYSNW